jgi:hypothetical protein
LTVLGYDGEPYLRIGPEGVQRNRNSPATYLNEERYADVAVPPRADPDAPPDWEQLSRAARHAWHDHRAHWMAPAPPPAVTEGPDRQRRLHGWSVPFAYDGTAYEVRGVLHWTPGPARWPWLLAGLVLTAPAALALRRPGADPRRPAALVVAAVALANLAHLPDEVVSLPLPALDIVFGLGHNLLFITVALGGALLTWRGSRSLLPLGVASGAVLFHQGLLQVSQLGASQLPTVWPPALIRLLVGASIAQAVWVAAVLVRARRRATPAPRAQAEDPTASSVAAVSRSGAVSSPVRGS